MKKSVGIRENSYSLFHSSQSLSSRFEQIVSSFENTKNSLLIWIFGFLVLITGCATTYNPKQNSFEVVLIDENTDIPYTLTTNFNFNFKEDVPGRQGIASDELLFPLNKNNLYYGYLFINSDKPNEESIIGYWKQDTTIFELDASHLYDLNRKKFAYTPTGDEVGIYNAEKKTWCGTVAKYNGDFVLALDKHCLGLVVDEITLEKIQPVTKLYEHRSNQELRKLLTQECQMRRILLDNYPKSSESLPNYCNAYISQRVPKSQCYESTINKPQPFMGNDGEVFILSDGSIWEVKYEYEYMYEYYPDVVICPNKNILIINDKELDIEYLSSGSVVNGNASVVKSYIDGEWGGWQGDTIVKLMNGQIWEQFGLHLSLSLGLGNEVLVYQEYGTWYMQVEGEDEAVAVIRIK